MMDNAVENVDEKNFYLKEEEEEVLRQLREIQQLQAPSSASSGGSSSQNNNYKFSETDVASVKTEMSSSAMYEPRLKHESPQQHHQHLQDHQQQHQQFSIQQQLFQRDDSPLQQQGQQVFAYAMPAHSEAQLTNTSALQNAITSLSCKECGFHTTNWQDFQRHLMTAHVASSEDEDNVMKKKKKMMKSDFSKPTNVPLPRTAYAFFVQICHDVHRRKHPDQKVEFSEFSRKCAARWKTMTPEERKRFDDMAEEDRTRYDLQTKPPPGTPQRESMSAISTTTTPKRKKMKRDPNQPKRPLTPFFFFCAENRNAIKEKDPSRSVGDIAKILGAQWSQLTMEEKQIYEIRASADRERYEKDMAEYTASLNGGGLSDSHGSPSKVSFPGSLTQKVVVQMPQNGNAQLQMQSQQQIQLSALMQHQQQQQQQQHQQQQHQLETTSQTLNHQQQQALLAALQHHDKLKGFSLDVSDGTSHQSTPTQSPTSAINYSLTGSASPSDMVTSSPQASLLENYSDMQMRNAVSTAAAASGRVLTQDSVAIIGGGNVAVSAAAAANFLDAQHHHHSISHDSNDSAQFS